MDFDSGSFTLDKKHIFALCVRPLLYFVCGVAAACLALLLFLFGFFLADFSAFFLLFAADC